MGGGGYRKDGKAGVPPARPWRTRSEKALVSPDLKLATGRSSLSEMENLSYAWTTKQVMGS